MGIGFGIVMVSFVNSDLIVSGVFRTSTNFIALTVSSFKVESDTTVAETIKDEIHRHIANRTIPIYPNFILCDLREW